MIYAHKEAVGVAITRKKAIWPDGSGECITRKKAIWPDGSGGCITRKGGGCITTD